ncbi:MAG: hypothetical protein JSR46_07725 [Verrucomicrobia bacterium]|nr:hypothetical protein [Verrucomicrobiota bacterium]
MHPLRSSGEIPNLSDVTKEIDLHRYQNVLACFALDELLRLSDRKICQLVALVLRQPFSEGAKSLVFDFLQGREELFASPSQVMEIAAAADATMRAHLLLWQCDTRLPSGNPQIKEFIHSTLLGILFSERPEVDMSVFAQANTNNRRNFKMIISCLIKDCQHTQQQRLQQLLQDILDELRCERVVEKDSFR